MKKNRFNLELKIIPHKEQIFSTGGYWTDDPKTNVNEIWVSRMADWRYIVCVLFHELIEWAWCRSRGVTQKACDDFDAYYEELYKTGKVSLDKDAGSDRKCPYFWGHWWGNRFERIVAWILKVNWKEYCDAYDNLYEKGEK